MTHIYDQFWVDAGDILKVVSCKIFTKKYSKLFWTHVTLPKALGLSKSAGVKY